MTGTTAIPDNNQKSLTSIIGLYQIAQDLYPQKSHTLPKKTEFKKVRASE